MTDQQLEDIFSYHAPTPDQLPKYEAVNKAFLECAKVVNEIAPDGAGKTVAIRKLSDARMACNASVALEGRF